MLGSKNRQIAELKATIARERTRIGELHRLLEEARRETKDARISTAHLKDFTRITHGECHLTAAELTAKVKSEEARAENLARQLEEARSGGSDATVRELTTELEVERSRADAAEILLKDARAALKAQPAELRRQLHLANQALRKTATQLSQLQHANEALTQALSEESAERALRVAKARSDAAHARSTAA